MSDLYERGVGHGPLYIGGWALMSPGGIEAELRPLTHPWEFPDRIHGRWPKPVLFPRWERFRVDAGVRYWNARHRLAERIAGREIY